MCIAIAYLERLLVKTKCAIQRRNSAHSHACHVIKFRLYSYDIQEMINNKGTYKHGISHNVIPAS